MLISDQQLLETMQVVGPLLFKRLTNELNVYEEIALKTWLNQQDTASKQFFEDCSDWERVNEALQVMYEFDQDAAFKDIQKKIQLETALATPVIELPSSTRKTGIFWAAAAVLLLIGGTVAFLKLNKPKNNFSNLPISQRFLNDVLPGSDKAILELADGSKITLDNASKGELAKQGGTRVIKLDDGKLSYKVGNTRDQPLSYNTISTPKGGQYEVTLPDGSTVILNAASNLRFPTAFSGNERKVSIMGEGFFRIAKNASAPFIVTVAHQANAEVAKSDPLEIKVLGTEFNLMAYPDEEREKVTLVAGSIQVNAGYKQKTLVPNQQVLLDKKSSSLNLIDSVNVDENIAWKNGRFQFHDASIESIMREVSRWYDVEISYDGEIHQQFKGTIPRRVNLSTMLKILEATGWVHFRIEGKKVIVAP